MDYYLINRQIGSDQSHYLKAAQITRLFYAIELEKKNGFDKKHKFDVNVIDIEKFQGRFLLSAGVDSVVNVWDLWKKRRIVGSLSKSRTHKYSISGITWYPNDSGLFVTSSLDKTVKVWDTNSLEEACTFNIDSKVYAHSISPSGLVACGAEYPQIRLCDLRTGGSTHQLVSHKGQVFAVQWSPRNEYILSSGGMDGTVRLWDIRRAAGCLASLDQYNSGLVLGAMNTGHTGACNGLQFTSDGIHLVSLGHDERIRVWDLVYGNNTLVGYPPVFRNRFIQNMNPYITNIQNSEKALIFVPSNDGYLVEFHLFEGSLVKKAFGVAGRLTCVTGRIGEEAKSSEIYTGTSDGNILRWRAPKQETHLRNVLQEARNPVYIK